MYVRARKGMRNRADWKVKVAIRLLAVRVSVASTHGEDGCDHT